MASRADPPSTADPDEPPPRGTLFVAVVRGVPVRLHVSALVALPFFAWLAMSRMRPVVALASLSGEPLLAPAWAWGLLLAVGLALAIAVHEGAHVLAARLLGARVDGLTFGLLLGCAHARSIPRASSRAAMAAAGPAVSLAAGMLLTVGAVHLPLPTLDARYALALLGQVQLALGLVELLPAPPLDGGRVLVALLEGVLGRARATLQAARLGRLLAALAALVGTFAPNLLLIGLAGLLWAGAERSAGRTERSQALLGVTVRALVLPAPSIDGGERLAVLAARMRSERAPHFVITEGGALAGVVTASDVGRVGREERAAMRVRQLGRSAPSVGLDRPAAEADALMRAAGLAVLPVVEQGALVGMLTHAALVDAEELGGLVRALEREERQEQQEPKVAPLLEPAEQP